MLQGWDCGIIISCSERETQEKIWSQFFARRNEMFEEDGVSKQVS